MAAPTATQYATATRKILSILSGWQQADIRELNVDQLVNDFRKKYRERLEPGTLYTYEACFRRAVPSFLEYVEHPESWGPPVTRRQRAGSVVAPADRDATPEAEERVMQIWLPSGRAARLSLPVDLSPLDIEVLLQVIPIYVRAVVAVTPNRYRYSPGRSSVDDGDTGAHAMSLPEGDEGG